MTAQGHQPIYINTYVTKETITTKKYKDKYGKERCRNVLKVVQFLKLEIIYQKINPPILKVANWTLIFFSSMVNLAIAENFKLFIQLEKDEFAKRIDLDSFYSK